MAGLGVFGIFLIVGIGSLVLAIMTAVSASKYPEWAFQQTATSKFVWVGVPIILVFVCGVAGGVMGIIWFTSKREQVEAAARSGGTAYGYGPPPQQYGAPPGWGPPPAPGQWSPPPQSQPPTGYPPPPAPPPASPPPSQPPSEPPQ